LSSDQCVIFFSVPLAIVIRLCALFRNKLW
jgi:hypothetical protein